MTRCRAKKKKTLKRELHVGLEEQLEYIYIIKEQNQVTITATTHIDRRKTRNIMANHAQKTRFFKLAHK